VATGVGYTAKDMKVGVGAETQLALVDELQSGSTSQRTDMAHEFLVGPSFQFRPVPQMHFDFAPLFGLTKAAARSKSGEPGREFNPAPQINSPAGLRGGVRSQ